MRLAKGTPRACSICQEAIPPRERAHTCRRCRVRRSRGVLVAPGARCAVCGESDVRVLRPLAVEGAEEPVAICLNDAARLGSRPTWAGVHALAARVGQRSAAA